MLRSLPNPNLAEKYLDGGPDHIVVYSDGENPPCLDSLEISYKLRCIDGGDNRGVVEAYNRVLVGFSHKISFFRDFIDEAWILLVDDDVVLPPKFFYVLRTLISTLGDCVLSWKSTTNPPEVRGVIELATELAGYTFAFPYKFFSQLDLGGKGAFDSENFHHYCGDSDFARRVMRDLHRPCYRVHYPLVIHEEHAAVRDNPELLGSEWAVQDRWNYKKKWADVKERDLIRSLLNGTLLDQKEGSL